MKAGDILNYEYTGSVQSVELPKGKFKLECWGAMGGYRSSSSYAGKGGYSIGTLQLSTATKVYIYVGGQGGTGTSSTDPAPGGFNGGGDRQGKYKGGGGASDVRIGQDSLYARVIVAGGGGSDGATSKQGMYGGGTTGGSSTQSYGSGGGGGTQTAGGTGGSNNSGTFGKGGTGLYRSSGYGGAGGGGWYGGGGSYPDGSGDDDRGGGGGSGYVYTSATSSSYPSGCLLNSSYYLSDASTVAGNTSFSSPTGSSEVGHSGDGYVRITVIEAQAVPNKPTIINKASDYFSVSTTCLKDSTAVGYKVYINGVLHGTTTSITYVAKGLNANTNYSVKVIAYNEVGDSDPSEYTISTTSSNFEQVGLALQSISLSWTKSSNASGYKLYRTSTLIATLDSSTTSFTDTGLLPSSKFTYTLKAYSGAVEGNSGTVLGKTEEAYYAQKVMFKSIALNPNPTTINTKVTLTVTAEDKLVIYEPEKFFSGEVYSGEI